MWCGTAHSLTYYTTTKVTRLLVDETAYGMCMALVSAIPPGVACSSAGGSPGWVTFACDGSFGSKTANNIRWSSAQLAMVTGQNVVIYTDDTKKINNHCYAPRIDVVATP